MILDAQNLYSDAQEIPDTTPVASTNIIDHGADRNLGIGTPMAVLITVDVGLAGDATETLTAALQTDDNASFSSATTVASTGALSEAQTVAGSKIVLAVPPNTAMERYSRLLITLGGTNPTATITAALLPQSMIQNEANYADAITIS